MLVDCLSHLSRPTPPSPTPRSAPTHAHNAVRIVRAQRQARLEGSIEELIAFVVRCVNDRRDHIPPVVSSGTITFPFDITFSGCDCVGWVGGWVLLAVLLAARGGEGVVGMGQGVGADFVDICKCM